MVGIPIPYPKGDVPTGFLAMNGQSFNPKTYPELAKKYPNNKLPDLRGEFIRGWDNGRGADRGRNILSFQNFAMQNIAGTLSVRPGDKGYSPVIYGASGVFKKIDKLGSEKWGGAVINDSSMSLGGAINFDASLVVKTANETRPRNVAFQYICLAG
ncbi:phage tail protein [Pasteurellaceae bacterium HPA106]|nr:phage tail protein [Spirabiliibacterium pneumoniae]